MYRIATNVFVEREANVDFIGDDGKRVFLERMFAHVTLPNERLPLRFLMNRVMPVGDYKAFLVVDASKDKLIISVDYDTMVLEKPSPAAPATLGKA